jgi:hypothetical protein
MIEGRTSGSLSGLTVTTTTSRGLELRRMSYTLREEMIAARLTIAEVR